MSHTVAAPVLVSTNTAAQMLDTSQRMVRYRIKRGDLPAKKLGKSWRVAVADIDALAAPQQSAA